ARCPARPADGVHRAMGPHDASTTANLLTPERCARLRDAFDAALELPAAQRAGWIDANIEDAEDRSALALLLDASGDAGPLDHAADERLRRIDEQLAAGC